MKMRIWHHAYVPHYKWQWEERHNSLIRKKRFFISDVHFNAFWGTIFLLSSFTCTYVHANDNVKTRSLSMWLYIFNPRKKYIKNLSESYTCKSRACKSITPKRSEESIDVFRSSDGSLICAVFANNVNILFCRVQGWGACVPSLTKVTLHIYIPLCETILNKCWGTGKYMEYRASSSCPAAWPCGRCCHQPVYDSADLNSSDTELSRQLNVVLTSYTCKLHKVGFVRIQYSLILWHELQISMSHLPRQCSICSLILNNIHSNGHEGLTASIVVIFDF